MQSILPDAALLIAKRSIAFRYGQAHRFANTREVDSPNPLRTEGYEARLDDEKTLRPVASCPRQIHLLVLALCTIDEEINMFRFKLTPVILTLGVIAPLCSNATDYCIAVNNGFGKGGTTFIGKGFAPPSAGGCSRWAGFLKTASSVVAFSSGTGCRSTDGKVLEFTITSTDPSYIGSGVPGSDHIKFCPGGSSTCPFGGGTAVGTFSNGSAKAQTCTSTLTKIPSVHD